MMDEHDEDLTMQIGWNQLFQQFVSDLFSEMEEKDAPVVTIDNLEENGKSIGSVLQSLRKAVDFVCKKYARRFSPAQLPETNHLSVLAEGLALYFRSALSVPQYEALSAQLSATTVHWLKTFINLDPETHGVISRDATIARNYACRVALENRFPGYSEEGYKVLTKGQPIFYFTNSALRDTFGGLGLPTSSFRFINNLCNIEKVIEEDIEQGNVPTMILAFVGSGVTEDLVALREISSKHSVFMHMEGDDLALLLTETRPSFLDSVVSFDSFSICPGEAYGSAGSSSCTFLRKGINSVPETDKDEMLSLSLWLTMQYVGKEQLATSIASASKLTAKMVDSLKNNKSVVMQASANCVLFRYEPNTKLNLVFHKDFLNNLTSQVLVDLSEEASILNLDLTFFGGLNYMRFRPLSAPSLSSVDVEDVTAFVSRLEKAMEFINATLSCAPGFEEEIQSVKGLQCVHVSNFVGLGAVRYLPSFLRGVPLSAGVGQEVDLVNSTLAAELAKSNELFSEGTTTDGRVCVCLGVETKEITRDSIVAHIQLITTLVETLHLQESIETRFGEILAKGIQDAEQHMKVENELAEVQQGLVRSIPVFGSVMNWLSPVEKKVNGKSFDIGSTSLRSVVLSPSPKAPQARPTEQNQTPPTTPLRSTPPATEPIAIPVPLLDPVTKEDERNPEAPSDPLGLPDEEELPKPEPLPNI